MNTVYSAQTGLERRGAVTPAVSWEVGRVSLWGVVRWKGKVGAERARVQTPGRTL